MGVENTKKYSCWVAFETMATTYECPDKLESDTQAYTKLLCFGNCLTVVWLWSRPNANYQQYFIWQRMDPKSFNFAKINKRAIIIGPV